MPKPKRIVVLTGAGISAESGLATFRGDDGLWEGHRIEDVATPAAWWRDPETVWRFYTMRRRALLDVEPNAAHHALVRLEREGPEMLLITQNVDDLHQRAGSASLLPMHGQLRMLRCERSGRNHERMSEEDLDSSAFVECSCCSAPSRMRPDIVWFGEIPMGMDRIHTAIDALQQGDLCLVVGTSGHVHPAAGIAAAARSVGATTVLVNLDPPVNVDDFDAVHLGPAGDLLPDLVEAWLNDWNDA
ncbi:MAG: NAD-dependent deacylase [Candidatus Poseidoniaceae archaeon]